MSSHADTIRLAINAAGSEGHLVAGAWDALDALLAENQRLRDALDDILTDVTDATRPYERLGVAAKAREALAGDAE